MKTQTALPGYGYIYNNLDFELDTTDHGTERTWLVFGLGTPSVRLLTEGERMREVDAHSVMIDLPMDVYTMWDSAPSARWIRRVTATEYDVLDTVTEDKHALVIGYLPMPEAMAEALDESEKAAAAEEEARLEREVEAAKAARHSLSEAAE